MGHTYFYIPDRTASSKLADASSKLFNRYETAYKPAALKLAGTLQDDSVVSGGVSDAGMRAGASFDAALETAGRNSRRYGAGMNIDTRGALDRANALDAARATGGAMTSTRRNMAETREDMAETVASIGKGVRGMGMNALQSAASMENERNAQGASWAASKNAEAAADEASKNQMFGTVMTLAGTAIGACFGMPWLGMAAGAGAGGMMGGLF